MTDDLRARPGVQAATYTWVTPLTTFAPAVIVHTAAQTHIDHSIDYNDVGDGYFSTMERGCFPATSSPPTIMIAPHVC